MYDCRFETVDVQNLDGYNDFVYALICLQFFLRFAYEISKVAFSYKW